mmetsp:Transcript_3662/g.13152  ORF Transcript_3662/g.13152 Transcript_3662/m.13152 type:complete len:355 (+) Transcript_3662:130-1194(+)
MAKGGRVRESRSSAARGRHGSPSNSDRSRKNSPSRSPGRIASDSPAKGKRRSSLANSSSVLDEEHGHHARAPPDYSPYRNPLRIVAFVVLVAFARTINLPFSGAFSLDDNASSDPQYQHKWGPREMLLVGLSSLVAVAVLEKIWASMSGAKTSGYLGRKLSDQSLGQRKGRRRGHGLRSRRSRGTSSMEEDSEDQLLTPSKLDAFKHARSQGLLLRFFAHNVYRGSSIPPKLTAALQQLEQPNLLIPLFFTVVTLLCAGSGLCPSSVMVAIASISALVTLLGFVAKDPEARVADYVNRPKSADEIISSMLNSGMDAHATRKAIASGLSSLPKTKRYEYDVEESQVEGFDSDDEE